MKKVFLVPREKEKGGIYEYSTNLYNKYKKDFVYYDELSIDSIEKIIKIKKPQIIEMQYDPIFFKKSNTFDLFYNNLKFFKMMKELKKELDFKFIISLHEVPKKNIKRILFFKQLFVSINKTADKIILLSKYTKNNFLSYKKTDKIIYYPHPTYSIATGKIDKKVKDIFSKNKKTKFVLLLGIISENKGFLEFIQNTKRFFLENKNAKLIIAGSIKDKDYFNKIQKLVKDNKLSSKVIFYNKFLTKVEIFTILKKIDLLAIPYKNISQSGILNYGLSTNSQIITSNLDAFREFEEKRLITIYNSKDALNKVLEKICSGKKLQDKKTLEKYYKENLFDNAIMIHEKLWKVL